MTAIEPIQIFVEEAQCATSVELLADSFGTLIASFGFTEFLVCSLCDLSNRPPGAIWVNRYNLDWTANYLAHRYCEIDPIFAAVCTRPLPFIWSEILDGRRLTPEQIRLFEDARKFGHRYGLSVPIQSDDPYPGCVALTSDQAFDFSAKHTVHLLALHMFEAARRLNSFDTAIPRTPSALSPRELECLRWAAVGKSNWDIGIIMHISEATVRFHLEKVRRKYGVTTTAQAVARATMLGLLKI